MSKAFLTFWPNFYQIFENLQLLNDRRFCVQVKMVTGVEHQHGGEADGEVVGVHLVPGSLETRFDRVAQAKGSVTPDQSHASFCHEYYLE